MKKPLVNDFGTGFVSRDKARATILAAGFSRFPELGSRCWQKDRRLFLSLREAWAFHTGVPQ